MGRAFSPSFCEGYGNYLAAPEDAIIKLIPLRG
jgi:hypothetical protein